MTSGNSFREDNLNIRISKIPVEREQRTILIFCKRVCKAIPEVKWKPKPCSRGDLCVVRA